ncbi:MAG: GNAT family N-acetyltransferase [Bacteroidales bacterium]|jgi:ribosomal protein S18 acetylase RimI-like enzyme|nr:GNAT family N-acetyltransferase [Bacteroidales bacterium]
MYIRVANIMDLPAIIKLMKRVIPVMLASGNEQWDDEYPTKEIFKKDINEHNLFVLIIDKQVLGAVVINAIFPPEYKHIPWKTSPNTYTFHRMMVDPEIQGKGIATALFRFIEKRGKKMGLKSVRVDTNTNNKTMRALFEKFNYTFVGIVHFRNKPSDFRCYEKTLF